MDGDLVQKTAVPVQPATTGWVLAGRYRVLDRIGSGGMAEVFRAHDELLNRDVAVKVFRAPVDEPGNASSVERREVELRALAQLGHPHLITLYDGSLAQGQPAFLVMEFVDGPNLADRLLEGPVPEPQVRELGAQIADALAYVHARGMVHRDVKPANILLGTDGSVTDPHGVRARLSDFGIVRMVDNARLTAVAFTLGTASYLAPEQARGSDVDAAADVYALGLVLIEALTGVRSFDGPQHEAVAARLVRSPDIPPNLPEPWSGLLTAMTASDPAARPSAAEVARNLRSSAPPAAILDRAAVPLAAGLLAEAPAALGLAGSGGPMVVRPPEAEFETEHQLYFGYDEGRPPRWRGSALLVAAAVASLIVILSAGYLVLRSGPHHAAPAPATGSTSIPTGAAHRSGAKTRTSPSGTSSRGAVSSSQTSSVPSASASSASNGVTSTATSSRPRPSTSSSSTVRLSSSSRPSTSSRPPTSRTASTSASTSVSSSSSSSSGSSSGSSSSAAAAPSDLATSSASSSAGAVASDSAP